MLLRCDAARARESAGPDPMPLPEQPMKFLKSLRFVYIKNKSSCRVGRVMCSHMMQYNIVIYAQLIWPNFNAVKSIKAAIPLNFSMTFCLLVGFSMEAKSQFSNHT